MFFLLYGETSSTKAKGGNRDFIERYDLENVPSTLVLSKSHKMSSFVF